MNVAIVHYHHYDLTRGGVTQVVANHLGAVQRSNARPRGAASEIFRQDPSGGEAIPNWTRVLTAFPNFPQQLRAAASTDAEEFGS